MTEMNELLDQIKILAYTKYMEKFCRLLKIIYVMKLFFASVIVILAPLHFIWKDQTLIGNMILILGGVFLTLFIIENVVTKTAKKVFENEWNKTMNEEL